jgi:hypothetical protein
MSDRPPDPRGFVFSLEFRLRRLLQRRDAAEDELAARRADYAAARAEEDRFRRRAAAEAARARACDRALAALPAAADDDVVRRQLDRKSDALAALRRIVFGSGASHDGARGDDHLRGWQVQVVRIAWDRVVRARAALADAERRLAVCEDLRADEAAEFAAWREAVGEAERDDDARLKADRARRRERAAEGGR